MFSSFFHLEEDVRTALAANNHGGALDKIRDYVVSVMNDQAAPGEVVGSSRLDRLCEDTGQAFIRHRKIAKRIDKKFVADDHQVVIVCSGLYRYGGTSMLIADIVKAHPGKNVTILITNFLNDMKPEDLALSRIDGMNCTIDTAPHGDSAFKLNWLIKKTLEIEPSRIFLLNHHKDSTIIAGIAPFYDKTKVIFYHHADYNLCLGVHMRGAIHVDPHNVGYFNCRHREHIKHNAYVPMTVSDQHVDRVNGQFVQNGQLITASSGTFHKFANFYLYPYGEMIASRLRVRNGVHIHIGNIPDHDLAGLRALFKRQGLEPARFIHVPWVPNLWQALIDKKVDLLIGSFPIGGARTMIEAMGAGIPLMMNQSYLSRFYSSRDVAYPDAYSWKYPKDFEAIIEAVTAGSLKQHSIRSRAHFTLNYCSEALDIRGRLDQIVSGEQVSDPYALYPHLPDHLDRALHYNHLNYAHALQATNAVRAELNSDC